MSLENYLKLFNARQAINVPGILSSAVEKLEDERYMLSLVVTRKNLPDHEIFFFIEGGRYKASLNDEEADLGVFTTALCMRVMSIVSKYFAKIYLHDTFEKTREEIVLSVSE